MPVIEFTDKTRVDFNPNHAANGEFAHGSGSSGAGASTGGTLSEAQVAPAQKLATKLGGQGSIRQT